MKSKALSVEDFYNIAKIVDNDFIDSEKTFTAERKVGYNYATTNKCDYASFLRIWNDGYKVSSIERLGEDTDGFKLIHPNTMTRVQEYISSNKTEK